MSEWKMQREEVITLIAAYKKLKCLWDFRSNEYKRYDLKKYGWLKLGNMFGKKSCDVKTKIKYLRSAYVSEKRKVDDSYAKGKIYRPNLFYYKDLNFLDSIIVCRKGPTFGNLEHNYESIADDNEQTHERTSKEEFVIAADVISPPLSPSPPQKIAESHSKIKKQHSLEPCYSNLGAAIGTIAEVTKTTSNYEDSIYSAFGKTIALQLSQLPPLDATATMSEIHQILSKNILRSMLSKNNQSSGERVVEHDRKLSMLSEVIEDRPGENNHQPNEFEKVSM